MQKGRGDSNNGATTETNPNSDSISRKPGAKSSGSRIGIRIGISSRIHIGSGRRNFSRSYIRIGSRIHIGSGRRNFSRSYIRIGSQPLPS